MNQGLGCFWCQTQRLGPKEKKPKEREINGQSLLQKVEFETKGIHKVPFKITNECSCM